MSAISLFCKGCNLTAWRWTNIMLLILWMSCTSIGLIMTWRSNSELSDGLVECRTLLKVEVLDPFVWFIYWLNTTKGTVSIVLDLCSLFNYGSRIAVSPIHCDKVWDPLRNLTSPSLHMGRKVCDAGFNYKGSKLPTLQPHNVFEICIWWFQINSMIEAWNN
jgi:hypothetical protein